MDLHDEVHLPAPDVLRRHLFAVMPQLPDFKISVNGVECSAGDVIGERTPFSHEIPGVGLVTGFYIIANARQPAPGLAVRVRGRIVQEPSLFGLDTRAHGFFTSEKIVGEINAEFMDPPGQTGRRDFIKTSRDGFLEDSEIVQRFNAWAAGFVKRIVAGVDKKETKRRTDGLVDRPEIRSRLDALPPHIKLTALKVVRGIITRLKTASDEDAEVLIEWILRYYESNQLKELMHAILTVDIHETEKLATLINHWGVSQLNQVVAIIDSEIRIISRLEELIKSKQSREIDLHKLIENNLWLVQKGLELWGSDKPLKTLLDQRVKTLYKNKQNLRPDIVCRSRDSGHEAIILEFKRPAETISMAHVVQALTYEGIIAKHRPHTRFKTYVIGREYHPDVLAVRDKQEQAGLFLRSFDDILQAARERFQDTLAILER